MALSDEEVFELRRLPPRVSSLEKWRTELSTKDAVDSMTLVAIKKDLDGVIKLLRWIGATGGALFIAQFVGFLLHGGLKF